jgi:hypothetical protein
MLSSVILGEDGDSNTQTTNVSLPVLLDCGTTQSFLPDNLFIQLRDEFGATFDNATKEYVLPCDMSDSRKQLTLQFGGSDGPRLPLDVNQLVIPHKKPTVFQSGPNKGKEQCRFGILGGANGGQGILGDVVMRSAYVVHDLVNNEIAIAEAKFNVSKSNVVPFASMGATIPESTTSLN